MMQTLDPQSPPALRRRSSGLLRLVFVGLALVGTGVAVRIYTTDALSRWRAGRLSDEALARDAARPTATFGTVFEWARRLENSGRPVEAERVYTRATEM